MEQDGAVGPRLRVEWITNELALRRHDRLVLRELVAVVVAAGYLRECLAIQRGALLTAARPQPRRSDPWRPPVRRQNRPPP